MGIGLCIKTWLVLNKDGLLKIDPKLTYIPELGNKLQPFKIHKFNGLNKF